MNGSNEKAGARVVFFVVSGVRAPDIYVFIIPYEGVARSVPAGGCELFSATRFDEWHSFEAHRAMLRFEDLDIQFPPSMQETSLEPVTQANA